MRAVEVGRNYNLQAAHKESVADKAVRIFDIALVDRIGLKVVGLIDSEVVGMDYSRVVHNCYYFRDNYYLHNYSGLDCWVKMSNF